MYKCLSQKLFHFLYLLGTDDQLQLLIGINLCLCLSCKPKAHCLQRDGTLLISHFSQSKTKNGLFLNFMANVFHRSHTCKYENIAKFYVPPVNSPIFFLT